MNAIKATLFASMVTLISTCIPVVDLDAQQIQITNPTFAEWNDDGPVGWTIENGATSGNNGVKSTVSQGEGPSLLLAGDANTAEWMYVSQSVPVEAGATYRLSCSICARDLKVEPGQNNNCWVRIVEKSATGQQVGQSFLGHYVSEFRPNSLVVRTNAATAEIQIGCFLSNTGTLGVKDFSLNALQPAESFQVLVDEFDRHYSYFEHKQIDWPEVVAKHREELEAVAEDPEAFVAGLSEMLSELKDGHVWIDLQGKKTFPPQAERPPLNFDFEIIQREIQGLEQVGRIGGIGKTKDGFGYVIVASLTVDNRDVQRFIRKIKRELMDCPGIIVDLRANGGGAEPLAQAIASLFNNEPRTYAMNKFRAGPGHDQFTDHAPRMMPAGDAFYDKPVVCLSGPGAVSSAEGMVMMMKALPNVTVIGQPTRGSTGNPAAVQLPNGVDVLFSRWVAMLPDGTPIEDTGVPPDELVEHGDNDPTLRRAIELLKEKQN